MDWREVGKSFFAVRETQNNAVTTPSRFATSTAFLITKGIDCQCFMIHIVIHIVIHIDGVI